MDDSGGWTTSAAGWIKQIDHGDYTRDVLLDGPMLSMCGDVQGRLALDLGCGEGRFCRMLSHQGAVTIGLDPTIALLAECPKRHPGGRYLRANGEILPFQSGVFDLVVSYLTLIDIPNFRSAIAECARVLKPGGKCVIANIAPHASTSLTGWAKDADGNRTHFPIDDYLEERGIEVSWRDICVINYHRPLSAYLQSFLECGFVLKSFVEPSPTPDQIREHPDWDYDRRVPYVHAMLWETA